MTLRKWKSNSTEFKTIPDNLLEKKNLQLISSKATWQSIWPELRASYIYIYINNCGH